MIRSRKILNHARGQPCLLALPGCNCDPETTVFAHLNGGAYGKGMAQKASDIAGMFAGFECHSRYDLRQTGLTEAELNAALLKAVIATWEVLIRDGVIIVPVDAETLSSERPVKPRKPKSERKAINSRPFPKQSRGWRKREE
jgi:hypothetical protein